MIREIVAGTPEHAELGARIEVARERDVLLRRAAATSRGGDPGDYYVLGGRAWPVDHGPGGVDCPGGARQCGRCHRGCDDPGCGICQDRAMAIGGGRTSDERLR